MISNQSRTDPKPDAELGVRLAGADGQTVILVVDGLAPPPLHKAYQLWLIREGEEHISGGLFVTDANGRAAMFVHADEPTIAFVAAGVTKEAMTGSPGPTSPPMLFGTLR